MAVLLISLLPAALAEDPSTYPAGVTDVQRTVPEAGGELAVNLTVEPGVEAQSVSLYVCHFRSASDGEPDLCWNPTPGQANGTRIAARSSPSAHPAWAAGTELGFKLAIATADGTLTVPASGAYYRMTVGRPTPMDPTGPAEPSTPSHATAALAGGALAEFLVLAAVVRRR